EMLLSGDAIAVFRGEEAISAQLLGGPITDLNLMTRRGVWSHELRLVRLQGEQVLVNDAELLLLWNAAPEALRYQLPEGGQQVLTAHSGVLLENEQGRLTLESDQPSPLYVGRMRRG